LTEKRDYGAELRQEYERWDQLFYHGGQDPFWTDGANLNLVRNHIISCREISHLYGWRLL